MFRSFIGNYIKLYQIFGAGAGFAGTGFATSFSTATTSSSSNAGIFNTPLFDNVHDQTLRRLLRIHGILSRQPLENAKEEGEKRVSYFMKIYN